MGEGLNVIASRELCGEATQVYGRFNEFVKGLFKLGLLRRFRAAIRGPLLAMTRKNQTAAPPKVEVP